MYSLILLAKSIVGPMPEDAGGITKVQIIIIVSSLLAIARVIVKITKTKKDDKALAKLTGWLKVVEVVTGLRFGVKIKK